MVFTGTLCISQALVDCKDWLGARYFALLFVYFACWQNDLASWSMILFGCGHKRKEGFRVSLVNAIQRLEFSSEHSVHSICT